jgi:GNAT superfamily N-acetyltransferase
VPPDDCVDSRLTDRIDLTTFRSKQDSLDRWLIDSALNAERMGTARTRVWLALDRVVGYYSLSPHVVARTEIDRRVGRGSPDSIPAILLARLALDASRQGRGEGSILLVDALTVALEGMRRVGGRLVVVDAIDSKAAAVYAAHDFTSCPGRPDRLVLKASDAAASLGLPWP